MGTTAQIEPRNKRELRLAVTGHRHIEESEDLVNSIHVVLNGLIDQFPNSRIILFSALAEGSDQLIAQVAKTTKNVELIIPLPLPIDEYLKDFGSTNAIENFYLIIKVADEIIYLPSFKNHKIAYQNLGRFLVNECDCLIAIWDGVNSNEVGGTGEVVKMAITAKKPVIWIYQNKYDDPIPDVLLDKKPGEIEII